MTTSRADHEGEAGPPPLVSELCDDASIRDLLEGFVDGLPARMEAITAAIGAGDRERAKQLVHRLGGTAGSFGFPAITRASAHLEWVLRRGEGHAAALRDLGELCRAARARSD
jgi:HPt (histidine-containing phosphotransfer) domain-containing protein